MTQTYYVLAERPRRVDLKRLGVDDDDIAWRDRWSRGTEVLVRAKLAGEVRPPRKGEWYLSGVVPEAWRAPNDLSTEFHILQLVLVRKEIRTIYTEINPEDRS